VAVWAAFAMLVSIIVFVSLSLIRYDREEALQRAESELLSLTRVLEEHVARSFGETEAALSEIAARISQQEGIENLGEAEIRALLRQRAAKLPEAEFLFVEREDGSLAADSSPTDRSGVDPDQGALGKPTMPHQLSEGVEIGVPRKSPRSGTGSPR